MMTTNMVPTKWHWWHGQSDNQLYVNNNGGKTGQWPIATTATATKWGRNNNDNKYDSRERGGTKTARTTTARARTMMARTMMARTMTARKMPARTMTERMMTARMMMARTMTARRTMTDNDGQ